MALRSWPAQPAAQFDAEARAAAFGSLADPLVQLLQQAAAHGSEAEAAAAAVRQAAAVAAGIVQSYAGSPKAVRSIVSGALAGPVLNCVTAILHASSSSGGGGGGAGVGRGKASAALLRLVAACLEVLASELGSEAVEQLLGALVNIFGAAGKCCAVDRLRAARPSGGAAFGNARRAGSAALFICVVVALQLTPPRPLFLRPTTLQVGTPLVSLTCS